MGTLQAGAAQVDITPPLGSHIEGHFRDRLADNVHTPLFAKAIAIADGETTVGLVVCDLIFMPREIADAAKQMIEADTGVPPSAVVITGTHTHYGPSVYGCLGTPRQDDYVAWAPRKIADAFAMAFRRLAPAQMGHASGSCPSEAHNRRWVMKDGSLRTNPGRQNPDLDHPAGPIDPELGLLVLRTAERKPIAAVANYALHYVGGGPGTWLSSDYFGAFGTALQRCAGDGFVAVMANGCTGDINNIDFTRPSPPQPHPYAQVERVANVAAGEAWSAWSTLREDDYTGDVRVGGRAAEVPFEPRRPSDDEMAAARTLFESGEDWANGDWIYARELVLLAEMPAAFDVPIQALRIGDLGLVGLPGEIFVEIGLAIKGQSPFARTMTVSVANAMAGYIPTDAGIRAGGYETRLARHACAPMGTEGLWVETATRLLTELHQEL